MNRRGRRQDAALDPLIRAAALKVFTEVGYRGLTMDAVAVAAGVGKATVYRRWPTRQDLLIAVIEDTSTDALVVPDSGCLREDLIALLDSLADVLAGPGGVANRALLGVLTDEPALAEAYRRGPLRRWTEAFTGALDRAVQRQEIPPAAAASLGAEAGPAIVIERWLFAEQRLDAALAVAIVDEVMLPLLGRASTGAD